MKKLIKFILYTLGILVVLLLLLALTNPLWLGPVTKAAVKSIVSSKLKCDVDLASCSINAYTGKVRLEGFVLKNPQGYDEPNAVSFESLDVDLSVSSLLTDKIVIHDITLEKPFVSYVFDGAGSNNFARIAAALETPEEADKDKKEESGKKVLIDRLTINGLSVKYRMMPACPIPLPTFTKIGYGEADAEPQGTTWSEALDVVLVPVKNTLSNVVGAAWDGGKQLVSGVVDTGSQLISGVTESKAGAAVSEATSKAVNATTDAVKDGAKAVGDKLQSLNPFGGK